MIEWFENLFKNPINLRRVSKYPRCSYIPKDENGNKKKNRQPCGGKMRKNAGVYYCTVCGRSEFIV